MKPELFYTSISGDLGALCRALDNSGLSFAGILTMRQAAIRCLVSLSQSLPRAPSRSVAAVARPAGDDAGDHRRK